MQRSIQDKSILVATYEGKHNHGVFHDLLKPSSSIPETSIMINNLPITNMPNDKDTLNIDLALCNSDQTDIRLCDEMFVIGKLLIIIEVSGIEDDGLSKS